MHLIRSLLMLLASTSVVAFLSRDSVAAEAATPATHPVKLHPRLLVMTDIGGDPDDQQSMVRLMLYSNEFQIEGLIASAAGTPGELKEHVTRPEKIRGIVEAYGQVRDNLLKHSAGYPSVQELLGKIKSGNPQRGKDAVGEGKDTDGSRWIISCIDREDPRPLNISIWGGQTDLAQALWRVRKDRGDAGLAKFVQRFRVHDIADQDGIAEWMWSEFPGMFYILSAASKGKDRRTAVFRGMYLGGDESLVSREWVETHIRQNHGPLGALYPPKTSTAPGPHGAMKEGDTPSWLYFLENGLNDPAHPEYGGWGGRFEVDQKLSAGKSHIYRDAKDFVDGEISARATVWRWRPAIAADFARRLDWCVDKSVPDAPEVQIDSPTEKDITRVSVPAGKTVQLQLKTRNPADQSRARFGPLFYRETAVGVGDVRFGHADANQILITAAPGSEGLSIHMIIEGCDSANPDLRSYRRLVVNVVKP